MGGEGKRGNAKGRQCRVIRQRNDGLLSGSQNDLSKEMWWLRMSQDRQTFWGGERGAKALGWELGSAWRCMRQTENVVRG